MWEGRQNVLQYSAVVWLIYLIGFLIYLNLDLFFSVTASMTWLIKAMLVPYCGPFPGPLPSLRCLVSVCAFCDLAALLMDSMLVGIRHIYTYGARLIVLFWHFYPTVFGIFEAFVWGKVWSCLSFLFLNIGFQIYYGLIVDPWYWIVMI